MKSLMQRKRGRLKSQPGEKQGRDGYYWCQQRSEAYGTVQKSGFGSWLAEPTAAVRDKADVLEIIRTSDGSSRSSR